MKDDVLKIFKNCDAQVSLSEELIEILTYSEDISKIVETFKQELNY